MRREVLNRLNLGCMSSEDSPFIDSCEVCKSKVAENLPCTSHGTNYQLLPKGNPWKSVVCKNAHRESTRAGSCWIVTGAEPLLPSELIMLRTRLLATGKKEDLQLWTMILLSVKLFLRSDEVVALELNHFVTKLFSVNNLGVTTKLAVKVKGVAKLTQGRVIKPGFTCYSMPILLLLSSALSLLCIRTCL